MKKTLFTIILLACAVAITAQNKGANTPAITAPPAEMNLDPFYKKYMNVNGLAVCSSERVPDSCFHVA